MRSCVIVYYFIILSQVKALCDPCVCFCLCFAPCPVDFVYWSLFKFPLNSGSQHPALCLSGSQYSVFQSVCILFSLSTLVTVFVPDSVFVKKIPLPSFPWTSYHNILCGRSLLSQILFFKRVLTNWKLWRQTKQEQTEMIFIATVTSWRPSMPNSVCGKQCVNLHTVCILLI